VTARSADRSRADGAFRIVLTGDGWSAAAGIERLAGASVVDRAHVIRPEGKQAGVRARATEIGHPQSLR
jgi:hypothetical protein